MKKKILWEKSVFSLFIISCFISTQSIYCQEYFASLGSPSHGFSNGCILLQDVWSAGNNQAAMSSLNDFTVGYSHAFRFSMTEIQSMGMAMVLPLKHVTFGATVYSWGNKHYHENKYGIGISKQISEQYFAGVQFDCLNTYIAEYDRMFNASFEIGFYGRPTRHLRIAVHMFNPFKSGIQPKSPYKTSSIYKLALGFQFDKGFIFEEIQTTIYEELNFITGIQYPLNRVLKIRFGYSTNPALLSGGMSLNFNSLHISCDFQYHNILGTHPSISVHHVF